MSMRRFNRWAAARLGGGVLLGTLALGGPVQAQSQFSVFSQIYGNSQASSSTVVTDLATGNILEQDSGTNYYDSYYLQDLKFSALGSPPVSPTASVTLGPGGQGFRQRGDAPGTTSATWSASAETTYGVNRAAVSITGAMPAGVFYDVNDGATRIEYSATPTRYAYAQSVWQDLFVVTPQNPGLLGSATSAQFSVTMSGSFTKDTSYFSYSLRNFDGTQSFGDSGWSYGAAANPGDPVSFGPVTNTYTFNLTYGQPFLVTGTLWAQVTDSEGAVDLMHTARITDIAIPANAAITFLSGAPGSAYGGVSGGVFGQYGGLPGGGGSGPILPSIPEPEIYAMLLAGLMLVGAIARRRRLPV